MEDQLDFYNAIRSALSGAKRVIASARKFNEPPSSPAELSARLSGGEEFTRERIDELTNIYKSLEECMDILRKAKHLSTTSDSECPAVKLFSKVAETLPPSVVLDDLHTMAWDLRHKPERVCHLLIMTLTGFCVLVEEIDLSSAAVLFDMARMANVECADGGFVSNDNSAVDDNSADSVVNDAALARALAEVDSPLSPAEVERITMQDLADAEIARKLQAEFDAESAR
jgi:hypothetical protein